MPTHSTKILFLHGLDSSRDSSKFHAIQFENKYCVTIDYRALNFQTVESFYNDLIEKTQPNLLIGHSLGGYWALKMSHLHQLPAIVANPSLQPKFRYDYPMINEDDLDHDMPRIAYLELGDEILDMYATQAQLEPHMMIQSVEGGHHRLACPENINALIEHMQEYMLKHQA